MAIIAVGSNSKDFEPMPIGNHQAVCAFVEDIGTHESSYQGKPVKNHQIVVCWELNEKMTEGDNAGKPFMISKFYTLSLHEKANLRKDLESWRGRAFTDIELDGFDVEKLIGANCLLNIIEHTKQDGSKFAKVSSISPIIKDMVKIQPINKITPEWIDKKRSQSLEYFGEGDINIDQTPQDDSLPF